MTTAQLAAALRSAPQIVRGNDPVVAADALFVGAGDSLSSCLIAEHFGRRSRSSGDITWTERVPVGVTTVVGVSHSGNSAATVKAMEIARTRGCRVVALTSNPSSPLARAADEVQVVPKLVVEESIPVAGHLMLSLGVATLCGTSTASAARQLAAGLQHVDAVADAVTAKLPEVAPDSISVLSLPDTRGAGDFWTLKLIEACGIAARSVPLEESGHVDYFIGPQQHLALQLVGPAGAARYARLGAALESTGQTVVEADLSTSQLRGLLLDLWGAILGAEVAARAAQRWGRPPFRGGAVNMDASHIALS